MFCNDLMLITAKVIVIEECNCFILIQIGVFVFLKLKFFFIHESIEVKMYFICKPEAPSIKSITINDCEHRVCKIQNFLRNSNGCDLVSLNFILNHQFLIICCATERFKPDSAAILQRDFLGSF